MTPPRWVVAALAGLVAAASLGVWLGIRTAEREPPPCHANCDAIERYALQRDTGPLPHDCRFFAACGCAYQCPASP